MDRGKAWIDEPYTKRPKVPSRDLDIFKRQADASIETKLLVTWYNLFFVFVIRASLVPLLLPLHISEGYCAYFSFLASRCLRHSTQQRRRHELQNHHVRCYSSFSSQFIDILPSDKHVKELEGAFPCMVSFSTLNLRC
jgi:hypothetical protein